MIIRKKDLFFIYILYNKNNKNNTNILNLIYNTKHFLSFENNIHSLSYTLYTQSLMYFSLLVAFTSPGYWYDAPWFIYALV